MLKWAFCLDVLPPKKSRCHITALPPHQERSPFYYSHFPVSQVAVVERLNCAYPRYFFCELGSCVKERFQSQDIIFTSDRKTELQHSSRPLEQNFSDFWLQQ